VWERSELIAVRQMSPPPFSRVLSSTSRMQPASEKNHSVILSPQQKKIPPLLLISTRDFLNHRNCPASHPRPIKRQVRDPRIHYYARELKLNSIVGPHVPCRLSMTPLVVRRSATWAVIQAASLLDALLLFWEAAGWSMETCLVAQPLRRVIPCVAKGQGIP
jgi:hypothetical protein